MHKDLCKCCGQKMTEKMTEKMNQCEIHLSYVMCNLKKIVNLDIDVEYSGKISKISDIQRKKELKTPGRRN